MNKIIYSKFWLLVIGAAVLLSATIFLFVTLLAPVEAAKRTIVEDGELFRASDVLGSKKFGSSDIEMLFGEAGGLLLVGKGYIKSGNAHASGGTKLVLMQDDGTNEQSVSDDKVNHAQFDKKGENVIYLTNEGYLYSYHISDKKKERISIEATIPNISFDSSKVVFKKAPTGWKPGEYFEGSPGIAVTNLSTGKEKIISNVDGDYAPLWSPNDNYVLVFNEGIHIMNADGSGRKQLTKPGDGTDAYGISDDPLWSSDGQYFLYEADGVIFVLELNLKSKKVVSAGPIAYGVEPRWVEEGKSISVVSPGAKAGTPALSIIALDGTVIKGDSENGITGKRHAPTNVPEAKKETPRTVPEDAFKLEQQGAKEIILPQTDASEKERKPVPADAIILKK